MKRFATRTITVLSLVAALGISVPGTAYGDSATASTNSTIAASTPWTTWHRTWVAYFDGLKSINVSYRSSVESARSAYLSAMAAATTEAESQTARANFETALTADINVRVAAISAAGDPPAPPGWLQRHRVRDGHPSGERRLSSVRHRRTVRVRPGSSERDDEHVRKEGSSHTRDGHRQRNRCSEHCALGSRSSPGSPGTAIFLVVENSLTR